MEQRPLRLGDVVDDYCPRERRITNHAIVAVVGELIKQTRCSTCDTEHVYKEAKVPRRKKAEPSAYDQVLGELTAGQRRTDRPVDEAAVAATPPEPPAQPAPPAPAPEAPVARAAAIEDQTDDEPQPDMLQGPDGWLSNRRLIRATLPKIDGELPPARPIPEFTMHQRPPSRSGRGHRFGQPWQGDGQPRFRERSPNGNPNANGNVPGNHNGSGFRHGHGRPADANGGQPSQPSQPGQPGAGGGDGQPRKSGRRRRRHRRPRSQP
jgi:hypothetical protein